MISGSRMLTYRTSRKGASAATNSERRPPGNSGPTTAADPGSSPSVSGETVVVAGDATLTCLDLETGKPIRDDRLDLAKSEFSSPSLRETA